MAESTNPEPVLESIKVFKFITAMKKNMDEHIRTNKLKNILTEKLTSEITKYTAEYAKEVKSVINQPLSRGVIKFHTGEFQFPMTLFQEVLIDPSKIVIIQNSDKEEIGRLPQSTVTIFQVLETRFQSLYKDAKIKTIIVDDSLLSNKLSSFFMDLIVAFFRPYFYLDLEKIVYLLYLIDMYGLNEKISDYLFSQITTDAYELETICIVCDVSNGKDLSPYIKKFYDNCINYIISRRPLRISIDNILPACFTTARGRHALCQIFKMDELDIDETTLYNSFLLKVEKINKTDDKISLKGFYDFLACIRFFHISQKIYYDSVCRIKEMYPDFNTPHKVLAGFNARINLIKNYKCKYPGTFSYSKDLNCINTRTSYSYEKSGVDSIMSVYTTDHNPTCIEFKCQITKPEKRRDSSIPKGRMKCVIALATNKFANKIVYITISVHLKAFSNNNIRKIKEFWNWTFGINRTSFEVIIPDYTASSDIIFTFHRVFMKTAVQDVQSDKQDPVKDTNDEEIVTPLKPPT